MKSNKEIAKLLFDRQEEFEPIIRAMNLDKIDFLEWMLNTDRNEVQSFWVMGFLGMDQVLNPKSAGVELHDFCTINRKEILEFYNLKFHVPHREN